jgi:hypothetical protein
MLGLNAIWFKICNYLASIDGKIGTGSPLGSATVDAGTGWAASGLAKESGGNLAAIAGKDLATQTTLALAETHLGSIDTHAEETADHVHSIDGKITDCNTGAIAGTVAVSSLPSGLATSALQLPDGHNVTVDNAAGAGAYVQPGTSTSWNGLQLNELIPVAYDTVACTNGAYGPTSVLFKVGAATVATLTITYDGTTGLVASVVRS